MKFDQKLANSLDDATAVSVVRSAREFVAGHFCDGISEDQVLKRAELSASGFAIALDETQKEAIKHRFYQAVCDELGFNYSSPNGFQESFGKEVPKWAFKLGDAVTTDNLVLFQGVGKISKRYFVQSDQENAYYIDLPNGSTTSVLEADLQLIKEAQSESKDMFSGSEIMGARGFSVGDVVSVDDVLGETREGEITAIHSMGDMADVDFGNGDVYGIMFNRMTKVAQSDQENSESNEYKAGYTDGSTGAGFDNTTYVNCDDYEEGYKAGTEARNKSSKKIAGIAVGDQVTANDGKSGEVVEILIPGEVDSDGNPWGDDKPYCVQWGAEDEYYWYDESELTKVAKTAQNVMTKTFCIDCGYDWDDASEPVCPACGSPNINSDEIAGSEFDIDLEAIGQPIDMGRAAKKEAVRSPVETEFYEDGFADGQSHKENGFVYNPCGDDDCDLEDLSSHYLEGYDDGYEGNEKGAMKRNAQEDQDYEDGFDTGWSDAGTGVGYDTAMYNYKSMGMSSNWLRGWNDGWQECNAPLDDSDMSPAGPVSMKKKAFQVGDRVSPNVAAIQFNEYWMGETPEMVGEITRVDEMANVYIVKWENDDANSAAGDNAYDEGDLIKASSKKTAHTYAIAKMKDRYIVQGDFAPHSFEFSVLDFPDLMKLSEQDAVLFVTEAVKAYDPVAEFVDELTDTIYEPSREKIGVKKSAGFDILDEVKISDEGLANPDVVNNGGDETFRGVVVEQRSYGAYVVRWTAPERAAGISQVFGHEEAESDLTVV